MEFWSWEGPQKLSCPSAGLGGEETEAQGGKGHREVRWSWAWSPAFSVVSLCNFPYSQEEDREERREECCDPCQSPPRHLLLPPIPAPRHNFSFFFFF